MATPLHRLLSEAVQRRRAAELHEQEVMTRILNGVGLDVIEVDRTDASTWTLRVTLAEGVESIEPNGRAGTGDAPLAEAEEKTEEKVEDLLADVADDAPETEDDRPEPSDSDLLPELPVIPEAEEPVPGVETPAPEDDEPSGSVDDELSVQEDAAGDDGEDHALTPEPRGVQDEAKASPSFPPLPTFSSEASPAEDQKVQPVSEEEEDHIDKDDSLDTLPPLPDLPLPSPETEEEGADAQADEKPVPVAPQGPEPVAEAESLEALLAASREDLRVPSTGETRVNPFKTSSNDPTSRAERLARTLVSDMIAYRRDDHQAALAEGKEAVLKAFADDIEMARREYYGQVPKDLEDRDPLFSEAVNDLLGNGQPLL